MVVASHWHDDHVGGLRKVVSSASQAVVYVSQALRCEDFLALLELYNRSPLDEPGITEMLSVFRQCREQKRLGFAIQDRILLTRGSATVAALSPSDASIQMSLAVFAEQIHSKRPGNDPVRVPATTPNHTSTVLWISHAHFRALLGADLETAADPTRGWQAIVNFSAAISGQASYYKIPHHGSQNGHHDDVWRNCLEPHVVAGLTPFKLGSVQLPLSTDVDRIASLTPNAYATGKPRTKKAALPAAVEKTLREMGKTVVEHPIARGFIRARRRLEAGSAWQVRCFHEAGSLESVFR